MGLYGPFSDHVPTMHMGLRFDPPRIRDNCSHDLFDTVGGELWGGVIASELVPMTAGVIG